MKKNELIIKPLFSSIGYCYRIYDIMELYKEKKVLFVTLESDEKDIKERMIKLCKKIEDKTDA